MESGSSGDQQGAGVTLRRRARCPKLGATPLRGHTALLGIALATSVGCSESEPSGDPAVATGKRVYQNVCIACHSADPTQDGTLGPALAGASAELLAAKVLRGEYPDGYTPKRPGSAVMPQFAYLEERIPDLAAYLASVTSDGS